MSLFSDKYDAFKPPLAVSCVQMRGMVNFCTKLRTMERSSYLNYFMDDDNERIVALLSRQNGWHCHGRLLRRPLLDPPTWKKFSSLRNFSNHSKVDDLLKLLLPRLAFRLTVIIRFTSRSNQSPDGMIPSTDLFTKHFPFISHWHSSERSSGLDNDGEKNKGKAK